MKILVSFCNQSRESKNNLLLLDLKSEKKEYLLETKGGFTGLAQDNNFFYALFQGSEAGIVIIDKKNKRVVLKQKLEKVLDPHSLVVDKEYIYSLYRK